MNFNIENLELLNVLQCVSSPYRIYRNRPSHALVFRRIGNTTYDFGDERTEINEGQVMFLPKGSNFTVTQTSPGISRYTVINFQGTPNLSAPKKLSSETDLPALYKRLDLCCTLDPIQDRYMLLSHFYWILSRLFETEKNRYHNSSTLGILDPAVAYIQENLFDPTLKIGSVHKHCGISDTYFRTLFIARFGTSPKKYLLDRRLVQAWHLLTSRECDSVQEVAAMSGFEDALYFSKVFKARYGCPPSEIVKSPSAK